MVFSASTTAPRVSETTRAHVKPLGQVCKIYIEQLFFDLEYDEYIIILI